MRMGKRMLALLAVALLLMGMLPMGALAAEKIPEQITGYVSAEVFLSDEDCQISMQVWDTPLPEYAWDKMEIYDYKWKILNGLDQTHFSVNERDSLSADYFCTKAEAANLVGKGICQCEVYDGQKNLMTITFEVADVIYAPVPSEKITTQYVYYTPGKPVIISIQPPAIGGNQKIDYQWYMYKEGIDNFKEYRVNAPSITLTLGPEKDGWMLDCDAATEGHSNYKWAGSFILLNSEKHSPVTPSTPTSAPKTGDNTPLTALFLLLGISLAGVTVLASKRRGHEHS